MTEILLVLILVLLVVNLAPQFLRKVQIDLSPVEKSQERTERALREEIARNRTEAATTDFGILFLPTEGLFAEVVRRPGLAELIQRECKVVVAGPTTLWSILNSLQMGFRTLAIQQRSSEVWNLLAAVKTEFGKYGDVLAGVQKKLQEAANKVEDVGKRSRAIGRKLRDVQELPVADAQKVLMLEAVEGEGGGDEENG